MKPTTAPRTRIFCSVSAISFSPSEAGAPSAIQPTVLAAALNLMASGLRDHAAALLRDATRQPLAHCEDVVDFLLDMVKPAKPKAYQIDPGHEARADGVIEKALKTLMPKPTTDQDPVDAMEALVSTLASILKMPEMRTS